MLSFLNIHEFQLAHLENLIVLFGTSDSHLKMIENELGVSNQGETVRITGNEENIQSAVESYPHNIARNGIAVSPRDVRSPCK